MKALCSSDTHEITGPVQARSPCVPYRLPGGEQAVKELRVEKMLRIGIMVDPDPITLFDHLHKSIGGIKGEV